MANLTVLYSDTSWQAMGRIVGLTDDCVVATFPASKTNQVLFVPKSGGNAVKLDPFPGSSLSPVNAFGDYVIVQRAVPRKNQTTFLLNKNGQVTELLGGKLISRPNVFGARIDEGGIYGDIRNTTQVMNASWDFDGKINLIAAKNYIAGTMGTSPVFGDVEVQLPTGLAGSQALYLSCGWLVGRAYEVEGDKVKKSTGASVSWIWNGSGPAKVCVHPEGKKFSLVSVSPDGRFAAGLAWQNDTIGQESVVLDLVANKILLLDKLAECSEGGGVDFSSCRFDSAGNLYTKRVVIENGPFEIVKISNLDK